MACWCDIIAVAVVVTVAPWNTLIVYCIQCAAKYEHAHAQCTHKRFRESDCLFIKLKAKNALITSKCKLRRVYSISIVKFGAKEIFDRNKKMFDRPSSVKTLMTTNGCLNSLDDAKTLFNSFHKCTEMLCEIDLGMLCETLEKFRLNLKCWINILWYILNCWE